MRNREELIAEHGFLVFDDESDLSHNQKTDFDAVVDELEELSMENSEISSWIEEIGLESVTEDIVRRYKNNQYMEIEKFIRLAVGLMKEQGAKACAIDACIESIYNQYNVPKEYRKKNFI